MNIQTIIKTIAPVSLALITTTSHADLTWTFAERLLIVNTNDGTGNNQETRINETTGFWDETLTGTVNYPSGSTSFTSQQSSDIDSNGAMFETAISGFADSGAPSGVSGYVINTNRFNFNLSTDTYIHFTYNLQNPNPGWALSTFDLVIFNGANLLEAGSDPSLPNSFNTTLLLTAGDYVIGYTNTAFNPRVGQSELVTTSFSMSIVPTPSTLFAISIPCLMTLSKRRR